MDDYVHLFGRVSAEMLAAVYKAADLFVMPNEPVAGDMEGFGLVVLEANLFGLTVVASDLEGIHDAIEPGKNGRLIHWDSIENFATNIVNLLKSPEELAAAGERACEYALTNFSWDIIARRYLSEFQAVAGQGNTKR